MRLRRIMRRNKPEDDDDHEKKIGMKIKEKSRPQNKCFAVTKGHKCSINTTKPN